MSGFFFITFCVFFQGKFWVFSL